MKLFVVIFGVILSMTFIWSGLGVIAFLKDSWKRIDEPTGEPYSYKKLFGALLFLALVMFVAIFALGWLLSGGGTVK